MKQNNYMNISNDKRNLTREDLDMAKKKKSQERNWIFSSDSTKQHHKD